MQRSTLWVLAVCLAVGQGCNQTAGGERSPAKDPLTRFGGAVVGVVRDAAGQPLGGVIVAGPGGVTGTTDDAGAYALSSVPATRTAVLTFTKPGYTTNYRRIDVPEGEIVTSNAVLGTTRRFDVAAAEDGATLEHKNVRVVLQPGSVVDAAGARVTGPIVVEMATIDPMSADRAFSPSDYKAVRAGGEQVGLMTYGMVEVRLLRGAEELNLADGKPADVEMVIPDAMPEVQKRRAGDTIPLWWLNPRTATWEEQGAGDVRASTLQPGRLAYFTRVPHFSWWNCDDAFSLTCIEGYVEDCYGNPVANAQVTAKGLTYQGDTITQTDAQGFYRIWPVMTNARVQVDVRGVIGGVEKGASQGPVATPANPVPEGSTSCGAVPMVQMPLPPLSAQIVVTHVKEATDGYEKEVTTGLAAFFEASDGGGACPPALEVDACVLESAPAEQEGDETLDGGDEVSLTCEYGAELELAKTELEEGGGTVYKKEEDGMQVEGMDLDLKIPGGLDVEPIEVVKGVKMPEAMELMSPPAGGAVRWLPGSNPRGRVVLKIAGESGALLTCTTLDDGEFEIPADKLADLQGELGIVNVLRMRARYFPTGDGAIGVGIGYSAVQATMSLR